MGRRNSVPRICIRRIFSFGTWQSIRHIRIENGYRVFHAKVAFINRWYSAHRHRRNSYNMSIASKLAPIYVKQVIAALRAYCEREFAKTFATEKWEKLGLG